MYVHQQALSWCRQYIQLKADTFSLPSPTHLICYFYVCCWCYLLLWGDEWRCLGFRLTAFRWKKHNSSRWDEDFPISLRRYLMVQMSITILLEHFVAWPCPTSSEVQGAPWPCYSRQIQWLEEEGSFWNGLLCRTLGHHPRSLQVRTASLCCHGAAEWRKTGEKFKNTKQSSIQGLDWL